MYHATAFLLSFYTLFCVHILVAIEEIYYLGIL